MKLWIFFLIFFSKVTYSTESFTYPLPSNFYIHPGEGFCDEMYYHSYHSRKYHTAVDYIKKWDGTPLILGENNFSKLIKNYQDKFFSLPKDAIFWKNQALRLEFIKINLYREGMDIIDTTLGLYPRSESDSNYGHGQVVYAIYPGIVTDSYDPEEVSGWGKSILIEHSAPKSKLFQIHWKGKLLQLNRVWSGYFHNSENLVKKDDLVEQGQIICKIGDANGIFNTIKGKSGIQEGSHLHFEIRIRQYSLFPQGDILSRRDEIEKIYIDPEYFLKNVKIINKK